MFIYTCFVCIIVHFQFIFKLIFLCFYYIQFMYFSVFFKLFLSFINSSHNKNDLPKSANKYRNTEIEFVILMKILNF